MDQAFHNKYFKIVIQSLCHGKNHISGYGYLSVPFPVAGYNTDR